MGRREVLLTVKKEGKVSFATGLACFAQPTSPVNHWFIEAYVIIPKRGNPFDCAPSIVHPEHLCRGVPGVY